MVRYPLTTLLARAACFSNRFEGGGRAPRPRRPGNLVRHLHDFVHDRLATDAFYLTILDRGPVPFCKVARRLVELRRLARD